MVRARSRLPVATALRIWILFRHAG